MNGKTTAGKMRAREQTMKDPRVGLAGTKGRRAKPALVVAVRVGKPTLGSKGKMK